jgi:DNA-binding NarL/FixJ family response regulator
MSTVDTGRAGVRKPGRCQERDSMCDCTPAGRSLTGTNVPGWLYEATRRIRKLTPRQLDVLRCLAEGMDGRTIARALRCSERTVKLHTAGVVQRLGVGSRMQAALVGYHVAITGG